MSSGISEGSYNSANLVANNLNDEYDNKIYVVDTLTGATGGTLIHEIADKLALQGCKSIDIVKYLNELKKQIFSSFYVPDPKGFIRSGRNKSELCSKDKAILMGIKTALMAGIKFRVDFNEEGNLYTKSIFKSKKRDGMMKLIKSIINQENKNEYDSSIVTIGTLRENYISMDDLITYLEDLHYFDKIINRKVISYELYFL